MNCIFTLAQAFAQFLESNAKNCMVDWPFHYTLYKMEGKQNENYKYLEFSYEGCIPISAVQHITKKIGKNSDQMTFHTIPALFRHYNLSLNTYYKTKSSGVSKSTARIFMRFSRIYIYTKVEVYNLLLFIERSRDQDERSRHKKGVIINLSCCIGRINEHCSWPLTQRNWLMNYACCIKDNTDVTAFTFITF